MGLLSPWFLGGLLAAAVPLYVHLLRQHRTVPMQFSSLMFFEKRTQSSLQHRRLKYIALLLLRLLMILLLALMFANPFIRRSANAGSMGSKMLIVAVDNSFSMRAGDRLEAAKSEALKALGNFRQGDKGQVIAFASSPQMMTQPVEDIAQLRSAVQAIKPGDARSAYGEIARTLRSLAPASGPPVEAHIVTDVQLSSMPAPFSELALNTNTKLVLHPITKTPEPNWFVETVNSPARVFQPQKVRILATVGGTNTPAGEISASLLLNGKSLDTRKVNLAANGRASLEFFLPDAAYGSNRAEVRIQSLDKLPQDDVFPFSIERMEPSRVLFVHEARNARGVQYVRAALEARPEAGFNLDAVTPDAASNLDPSKFAFVVLSDVNSLPSSFEAALGNYVRSGGSVFIALGASASARGSVPLINATIPESRYASRTGSRFLSAAQVDSTHPALSQVNSFEAVRFFQAAQVQAKEAKSLARLNDGSPLLLEQSLGSGKVLVFTSTLDNIANDLPLQPVFVPFIERTAEYLSGGETARPVYIVDSFLELNRGRDGKGSVEVIGPDGQRALSLGQAAKSEALKLSSEGFYEVRRGNGRNELIAVHADRRESDLSVLTPEDLQLWQNVGQTPGGAGGPAGQNNQNVVPLWWYFALALLIASVAESLFAARYMQRTEEAPVVQKKAA